MGAVNRRAVPNAASTANSADSNSTNVNTIVNVSFSDPRKYLRR